MARPKSVHKKTGKGMPKNGFSLGRGSGWFNDSRKSEPGSFKKMTKKGKGK